MMAEVEVGGAVERDKVDVGVVHIEAHNGLAHLDAGDRLLETAGHPAREKVQLGEEVVGEVEDIIDFLLGDAKHMTRDDGVDIEKSETTVGLGYTVARYFTSHNT